MTEKVWEKIKRKYKKENPRELKIWEGWSYHSRHYLTLDKQWAFIKDHIVFYYENRFTKKPQLKKIHYKKLKEVYSFKRF